MNEEEFPRDLSEALRPTIMDFEALGWREIEIGWPTGSHSATGRVFLHATSPSGKRLHAVFDDGTDLINNVCGFLENVDNALSATDVQRV